MERSDAYIEDVERELEQYRKGSRQTDKKISYGGKNGVRGTKNEADSLGFETDNTSNVLSGDDQKSLEDPTFSNNPDDSSFSKAIGGDDFNNESTFNLDMPSPMSRVTSEATGGEQSRNADFSNPSTTGNIDTESYDFSEANKCKKRLKFSIPESRVLSGPGLSGTDIDSLATERSDSVFSLPVQPKTSGLLGRPAAQFSKSELNISMTPEIEDCLKLFDEAERKIEKRRSLSGSSGSLNVKGIDGPTVSSGNLTGASAITSVHPPLNTTPHTNTYLSSTTTLSLSNRGDLFAATSLPMSHSNLMARTVPSSNDR